MHRIYCSAAIDVVGRREEAIWAEGYLLRAVPMQDVQCKSCGVKLKANYLHAGFCDWGFPYCSKDSTVLTWNAYDSDFESFVGAGKMPWTLTDEDKSVLEEHLIKCPCGGRFLFSNHQICPECGKTFSEPMSATIYAVILGQHIDGESRRVWRD